ncbi:hypothetical protein FNV43_RR15679 [Rhamnella rubrinervis]|uniref:Protein pelota homolog n=1 Tax=Rhamnella rubrinervis TaxID=2594499 RepID=A0A8K0E9C3_9ROSA|nr:hypothetical protein FNV43_RR15679 [Rhamnella rubrinervis]
MKLVEDNIVVNKPGSINIVPEEPDDLWLVHNLIAPGDVIVSHTTRKVHRECAGGKGKISTANRVRVSLEILITAVDYDKVSSTVRVQGKNVNHNQHVAAGSFHTLQLERDKEFELRKKLWKSSDVDALREGCRGASGADLAVVLMQQGLALLFLVGRRSTTLCAKIEASKAQKKSNIRFFENVFRAFVKHVDFEVIRCAVIASTGFAKDEFRRYLLEEAQRLKMKWVRNKSRIVVVETKPNKGLKLNEVLHDDKVVNLIKDTQAVMEIRAFNEFLDALSSDSERACYGPKSVETAHELLAIETLLITDDLFRSPEVATRQKYIGLSNAVKNAGGNTFVFSPSHVLGEELAKLTGIAAVLRFPVPDIDDMIDNI